MTSGLPRFQNLNRLDTFSAGPESSNSRCALTSCACANSACLTDASAWTPDSTAPIMDIARENIDKVRLDEPFDSLRVFLGAPPAGSLTSGRTFSEVRGNV